MSKYLDMLSERDRWMMHPNTTLEDVADQALLEGDFDGAARTLFEAGTNYLDSRAFFHAHFKNFTLPLYDLARNPPTKERIRNANDSYGLIASLIDMELDSKELPTSESIGRLSELVIFSLLIRNGIHETGNNPTAAIPVLATRQSDIRYGIDIYLSPIGTGSITDGWPVQIKTKRNGEESDRNQGITVVYLSDLDSHAGNPHHQNSLANCLLRELNGASNDKDLCRLQEATGALYEKITGTHEVRRARTRQGVLKKMAVKAIDTTARTKQ